jgi:hypothetical protein
MRTATIVCLIGLLAFTESAVAQSERKSVSPGAASVQPSGSMTPAQRSANPRPPQSAGAKAIAPLTEAECKGLGGAVKDVLISQCASGRDCARADQDGVIHTLCIDDKKN